MLVATSFVACKNEETKRAEDAVKDKDTGTWTSLDSKTVKVRQLLEAYVKNDTSVIYEIMADTVKVREQFANNQENGKTKVDPGGRSGFAQGEQSHHLLFTDISLTTDNMRTFVWDNGGGIITGYWGMWSGTGRFTKNKITWNLVGFTIKKMKFTSPSSSLVQDTALSRRKQGFESPWGRQLLLL